MLPLFSSSIDNGDEGIAFKDILHRVSSSLLSSIPCSSPERASTTKARYRDKCAIKIGYNQQ
jgi:hypothetical protein